MIESDGEITAEEKEEIKKHREQVIEDLKSKGLIFEAWLYEKLSLYQVAVMHRGSFIGIIPADEYVLNIEKYRELINRIDFCVWYGANPKVGIEAGYRPAGFYFNPFTLLHCGCKGGQHISIPSTDLERYEQAHDKYPYVDHWIMIGVGHLPNVSFFAVRLEEWKTKSFNDYNPAMRDHWTQSVLCLKDALYYDSFEKWAKVVNLPKAPKKPKNKEKK